MAQPLPAPTIGFDRVHFTADELREFSCRVLVAAGAAKDAAELCAEVFVHADQGGTDTHGVARLGQYAEALLHGKVDGHARPELLVDGGAVLMVDGHNGLGPVGLSFATELAVRTAREHGVAVVSVRGSNHAGAMSWYIDRAADAGLFALVLTGSTKAMVSPVNGTAPFIGTNALAYAFPAGGTTVSFDASTSAAARSTLEAYQRGGRRLPEGWAVGPDGQPAFDPGDVIDGIDRLTGHSLLPFGGPDGAHKGFGVGLLIEILCGPLAGARWGPTVPGASPANVGHFVLCLDLGGFGAPAAEVESRIGSLGARLRAVPPAAGRPPVRMPGDRRRECADRRADEGIALPANVLAELHRAAVLTHVTPLTTTTLTGGSDGP